MRPVEFLVLVGVLIQYANAIGNFWSLAEGTTANQYRLGQQLDITWESTEDYTVLSLGFRSAANHTISWLIQDSRHRPTSFSWVLDPIAYGFDLSQSRNFSFLIVNGTDFGALFNSSHFLVANPLSASDSPVDEASEVKSSHLGLGAIIGIVMGSVLGVIGISLKVIILTRCRKETGSDTPILNRIKQKLDFSKEKGYDLEADTNPVHEVCSAYPKHQLEGETAFRAELDGSVPIEKFQCSSPNSSIQSGEEVLDLGTKTCIE